MKKISFILFPFLLTLIICQSLLTRGEDVIQENKSVQMSWPYFNLPYVKPWNNLKEPVAGYPASTWPLIASNARVDQTYDGINFGGSETKVPLGKGDTITRNKELGEGDVKNRFDLGGFAGQVAASAVGTVVGNAGVNLAGNFINRCNNRGKRSVLMHKLEKRQAVQSNKKGVNKNDDPEVVNRIICPQDLLGQGGNKNSGRYCERCNCQDNNCRYDCRKCSYGNNGGSSGNQGNHNHGHGNNGWSTGNHGNHHNGQAGPAGNGNNWSNSGNINCRTCNCRNRGCRNTCLICHNNNNNYPSNSGSSWGNNNNYPSSSGSSWGNNNGGWSNSGWRNSNGVNGRVGGESGNSNNPDSESNREPESETQNGGVDFGPHARHILE